MQFEELQESNMHSRAINLSGHQEHFRASEAAAYLKISESQLSKLRMKQNRSRGPRFANVAGCIVYRRIDLDEWIKSKIVSA